MAQYIRFTKTTKDDVTVGKFYEVSRRSKNGGYYFDDDAGDERYVSKDSRDSDFEVVDTSRDHPVETRLPQVEPSELPDGVVCIDYIDGYVAHFHDVDSFDIEERVGITMVVITDTEGGKTLIPFDRVRKIRLLHLTDGGDI